MGSMREMDNALERAVIMCEGDVIYPGDLPPQLTVGDLVPDSGDDLWAAMRHFERIHLQRVLAKSWDKREAARRLGIGLSTCSSAKQAEPVHLAGSCAVIGPVF